MVDRKDRRFFDFMCSCGDERMQECNRIYDDVKNSLKVNDRNFLNEVVYSLANLEHGQAEIVGIPSDMWSAISIEYNYDFVEYDFENCKACDEDDEPTSCEHGYKIQKFWIECDRIHHGLARAYQLVVQFDKK